MSGSGRKNRIAYFYDSAFGVVCKCWLSEQALPACCRPSPCLPDSASPGPSNPPSNRARSDDYTGYYYGPDHPMKPQRMAMTHQLVLGYGLHQHMDVYVSASRARVETRAVLRDMPPPACCPCPCAAAVALGPRRRRRLPDPPPTRPHSTPAACLRSARAWPSTTS